jgi:hypothetical protein
MRSCLAPVRTQNARTRTRARTDTQPGGSPVCSLATNATGSSPVCLNGSTGAATTALAAHGTRRSERRPPARQAAADGSDAGGRLAGQGRGRGVAHTLAGWRPWHVAVEEVQEGGGRAPPTPTARPRTSKNGHTHKLLGLRELAWARATQSRACAKQHHNPCQACRALVAGARWPHRNAASRWHVRI